MSRNMPEQDVVVHADDARLAGIITLPERTSALVLFAHGSGSSRLSPRNRYVATQLNEGGLGTLLFDLLTAKENLIDEQTREIRFDIGLLSRRLIGAIDWANNQPETRGMSLGLFGASTGSAAALNAAAARPTLVEAVVSRGGRPDLASQPELVKAPTLLIVGGLDTAVIEMNRKTAQRLSTTHQIEIVPGATHLFEETGTLEQVAQLACRWFRHHLIANRLPAAED